MTTGRDNAMTDAGQAPWYERLTTAQREWLFPRGQADIDDFLADVADGEKAGIPAKCDDPETLLRIARIAS